MARVRETKRRWQAIVRVAEKPSVIDRIISFTVKTGGITLCFGDWFHITFTVNQARRLRDWLTERCDEIERKSDG